MGRCAGCVSVSQLYWLSTFFVIPEVLFLSVCDKICDVSRVNAKQPKETDKQLNRQSNLKILLWTMVSDGQQLSTYYAFEVLLLLENGRYGHAPIRSDTSIRVYTTADTSTPCVGVPATCNIRPGRSLTQLIRNGWHMHTISNKQTNLCCAQSVL